VFMSFFGPRGIVIAATGVFIAIHIGFTLWALLPSNSRFYLSHSTDYCHHPSRFRSLYGKSV
jgi:hypothetical protein